MKIMIVDDDFVNRRKLQKLIQMMGHETVVASDGKEGWSLWHSERPKLVILDWMMPEINGIELCRMIRDSGESSYTYVILLTSRSESKDIVEGMDSGADDFITKPFVRDELIVRVRAGVRILGYETREIVIFSLAKLAETRDPDTGNHLERIRYYSRILAEYLAASGDTTAEIDSLFTENIFLTSPLHDIGKIGIPDAILLKPGKFVNGEFEIMQKHCAIGSGQPHEIK